MGDEFEKPPILDAVFEFGLVRLRGAVAGGPRQRPFFPRICLWVDQRTGVVVHFELPEPQEDYVPVVVESLGHAAERIGGFPREIQLRDPRLAKELRPLLDRIGLSVVVRESLPMLDEAAKSLTEFQRLGGKPEPGLLDVPGMTLDHVIAFAEAAELFYNAKPWRNLIDDDLIEIESPEGPPGTRFAEVLGAGGNTFGLGFMPTRKAHEDLRTGGGLPRGGVWSLQFGAIDSIPYDDGEAWERHGLPVAKSDAYPSFMRYSKSQGNSYPTPEQLAWAEGLLRAIAATTEEQLDVGRWEIQVQTSNGPATYKFSMPVLLEQMEGKQGADLAKSMHAARMGMEGMLRGIGQQLAAQGDMTEAQLNEFAKSLQSQSPAFTPTTPAERAQALCYEAYEARGRRQVQLARQALQIDPDCCEALLILAERVGGDPEAALPLYRRAVEAGERQLGKECFEQDAGHFWGLVETRPYMRARQQLAVLLMDAGKFEEAAGHLQEMLRLNPNDNQGNRYLLAQALLNSNRLDELDVLLNGPEYRDDSGPEWVFTRALLEFRRHGGSPDAKRQLEKAHQANPHVVPLLTGRKQMPPLSPEAYSLGSEEEAVACVEQIAEAWYNTDGAIEWLESAVPKTRKRAGQKKSARDKKRKRR